MWRVPSRNSVWPSTITTRIRVSLIAAPENRSAMTRIGIRLLALALLVLSPSCSPTAVALADCPTEAATEPAPGGSVRHSELTAEDATTEIRLGLHINGWPYNGT